VVQLRQAETSVLPVIRSERHRDDGKSKASRFFRSDLAGRFGPPPGATALPPAARRWGQRDAGLKRCRARRDGRRGTEAASARIETAWLSREGSFPNVCGSVAPKAQHTSPLPALNHERGKHEYEHSDGKYSVHLEEPPELRSGLLQCGYWCSVAGVKYNLNAPGHCSRSSPKTAGRAKNSEKPSQ
jgi:hypothetical protein